MAKKKKYDDDWLNDDITFCMSKCEDTTCIRHPSHIHHPEYPHSYSDFFGTELCTKGNQTDE